MASIKQRIADICDVTGPRPAGSEAERQAAEIIAGELEASGATVCTEQLTVKPRALQVLLFCSCMGYLAAYGLFWVSPTLSLALLVLVLSQIALRLTVGGCLWDLPLAKKTSGNVIGRIQPSGTVRQVLLFGGHHDSAFRMPLLERKTFRLAPAMLLVLVLSTLLLLGLCGWHALGSLMSGAWPGGLIQAVVLCFCGAGALCSVVLPACLLRPDSVMGANDNLSAVAVELAVAEEIAREGLEHTELWFVSFGSEEVGLVGSRAFVRRHKQDLKGSMMVNLESFGQRGSLRVITSELMAPTRHSPRVISLVQTAAQAAGIAVKPHWLPGGLTDAASFSREGLKATTILRLDEKDYFDHYHNPGDDLPAIREEGLEEAYRLCLQIVQEVEARAGETNE